MLKNILILMMQINNYVATLSVMNVMAHLEQIAVGAKPLLSFVMDHAVILHANLALDLKVINVRVVSKDTTSMSKLKNV